MKSLIDKLAENRELSKDEWVTLICGFTEDDALYASALAREQSVSDFGKKVFIRGIIEISNICKNDCFYCGIRKSNCAVMRYRIDKEHILSCCETAFKSGFRTFVLQGGEDAYFTDDIMCSIISEIKASYHECAITLSLGERSIESYKRMYAAGADRYLLRHETASEEHYYKLHPKKLSWSNRINCLYSLKEIGYQTGAGMMLGSPYQTVQHLALDMLFLKKLNPQMIGMGPFIPSAGTPFANEKPGSAEQTCFFISLCRLMLPYVLLPATTALGSIVKGGREMGILSGANVIMPNISPSENREKYLLYNGKIGTNTAVADGLAEVITALDKIGYSVSFERGDYRMGGNS